MNYFEMNALMLIASAPVIDMDAPLLIEVTPEGRYMAADIAARCPRCKDDIAFCCCPETAEEIQEANRAAMEAQEPAPDWFRSLGLADRLADDLRSERYND